jgi:hypothetical protein
MRRKRTKTRFLGTSIFFGLAVLLIGCESAGNSGGSGSTCDDTGSYTVAWKFSGSYSDNVSVATTWIKPTGELSDPSDTKYATIAPTDGTLLTETLPGCSGASINITMLDGAGDTDSVTVSNVTLSIYVDGSLADSVTLNGSYPEAEILPASGALTVVVGE